MSRTITQKENAPNDHSHKAASERWEECKPPYTSSHMRICVTAAKVCSVKVTFFLQCSIKGEAPSGLAYQPKGGGVYRHADWCSQGMHNRQAEDKRALCYTFLDRASEKGNLSNRV